MPERVRIKVKDNKLKIEGKVKDVRKAWKYLNEIGGNMKLSEFVKKYNGMDLELETTEE